MAYVLQQPKEWDNNKLTHRCISSFDVLEGPWALSELPAVEVLTDEIEALASPTEGFTSGIFASEPEVASSRTAAMAVDVSSCVSSTDFT